MDFRGIAADHLCMAIARKRAPIALKRAPLMLLLIAAFAGGPMAETALSAGSDPVAEASKKKKKKCKPKKKKGAKKGKKGKCKAAGTGSPGLPGKPLSPGSPTLPSQRVVTGISLTNNPILAGTNGSGLVRISQAAPSGGQPVQLTSANPARVTVPSSVHVAEGQTTASFQISSVAGPTADVDISATIGSSSQAVQLTIVEEPSLIGLELDYQCFPDVGLDNFGANRVTLDVPTPADVSVSLLSDDPFSLAVPPSVTVAGGTASGIFGVDTIATSPAVEVTGTLDTNQSSDTASVRDGSGPGPSVTNLAVSPVTVVSGNGATGTVTLNCEAFSGGATVSLSSDHPDVDVPPTMTVAADQLSGTFPITTQADAEGTATITATLNGTVQATLTLEQLGT